MFDQRYKITPILSLQLTNHQSYLTDNKEQHNHKEASGSVIIRKGATLNQNIQQS